MNTTPVIDNSKPAPWFARVYFADSLGRQMPNAYDQFRSRRAACAYWWMLARKNVIAFIPDENNFGHTNAGKTSDMEPSDLRAAIDQCEREYDDEGAGFDELADYFSVCRRELRAA